MRQNDIAKKLSECDESIPYVFISYSSKDYLEVWEDAAHLKDLGYNVWIDCNLNGSMDTWKIALEKIKTASIFCFLSAASR